MVCRLCTWILPLLALAYCGTVQAQGLLRKPRTNPAEQVPFLIKTLSSDLDERRRADAASELRDYDPKTFPEIVPALIEALKNDSSIPVRREAANSIGLIRPISQMGGYALEQAENNDPAIGVRAIANGHLKLWVLFRGYKKGRMPDPLSNQTEEPPVAEPLPIPTPKLGPSKYPNYAPVGMNPKKPVPQAPPLMPTQTAITPKSDRFIGQLMKRVKPDLKSKSSEDGPVLNPPR